MTSANGAVLDQYTYSPYGALTSSSGSAANPFTFGGQLGVISDGNGLAWMRNREYDPSARFTQPDPTGLAGGLNAYEYANDAPTTYIDPTGLGAGVLHRLQEIRKRSTEGDRESWFRGSPSRI